MSDIIVTDAVLKITISLPERMITNNATAIATELLLSR